uniref:Cationic amino acid transporter C-terminal domain-containing protein n=1 Tax=Salix viminalis TaxID=40686 RepID=A0A6N2N1A4_SALVM
MGDKLIPIRAMTKALSLEVRTVSIFSGSSTYTGLMLWLTLVLLSGIGCHWALVHGNKETGWAGYELPAGNRHPGLYFPFGVNGMLAGSATVFFAYIGFDSVASTAEEVKNPQRDLPLGIGLALSVCCCLYMMVSVVIVGLYLIAAGAVMALCSTLMGSILPHN